LTRQAAGFGGESRLPVLSAVPAAVPAVNALAKTANSHWINSPQFNTASSFPNASYALGFQTLVVSCVWHVHCNEYPQEG